ncbi:uncharacterized protein LOC123428237 [Hordeum vulgare subsp. vulgare]|uniref:uncharacterized protein LOC123428237 n=1 Tax=Hordeum vulgare subsp. vulgare TaxID=112509 RepID=UPI001D1A39E0|nr:uncharacterized protein LOC123428237 [Hordeum vulgare subsp. vulgare]
MGKKFAAKKPRAHKTAEPPIHPMDELRLKAIIRNNSRLQALGIPALSQLFTAKTVISPGKKRPKNSTDDSEAKYHPNEDDTSEGESSNDSLVHETEALQEFNSTATTSSNSKGLKDCKKTSQESSKKRSAAMALGGVKPRPRKRVLADVPTSMRVTRSRKVSSQNADASAQSEEMYDPKEQTPSVIHKPTLSISFDCIMNILSLDSFFEKDDDLAHCDDDNWLANGADLIAHCHDDNQRNNEAGGSTQPHQQSQPDNNFEGSKGKGPNLGKGLERITRCRQGKLPLVIPEGSLRPEAPLLAAKFATECNVIVRHHMPVFKHWKDYKDSNGNLREGIFRNFVGKVGNKFRMDLDVMPVRKACTEMLKSATRQQRYRLKKEYFDPHAPNLVRRTSPVPSMTDDQWNELVESWKDPKKMGISQINKANRAQVKFHQTTGARSYAVHCGNLGDKYKDTEPSALDLFKACHYSKKKKCYTNVVLDAITEMENKASQPTEDSQESSNTTEMATEVVAQVLAKHTKKPRFLQNVGIQHVHARSNAMNREAELAAEKRNVELQARVDTLTNKLKESEEERARQHEEYRKRDEENRKKQSEMDAKLDLLLSLMPSRSAQG